MQSNLERRKPMVKTKLAQMNCASLEIGEIERCLGGCVAANKLKSIAMYMVKSGELTMSAVNDFSDHI